MSLSTSLPWLDLGTTGLTDPDDRFSDVDDREQQYYFVVMDFMQAVRDCGEKWVLDTMIGLDPETTRKLYDQMYLQSLSTPEERCVLLNKKAC